MARGDASKRNPFIGLFLLIIGIGVVFYGIAIYTSACEPVNKICDGLEALNPACQLELLTQQFEYTTCTQNVALMKLLITAIGGAIAVVAVSKM